MPRNAQFHADREPLRDHDNLRLRHATGPFSFLNPTRAHYTPTDIAGKPTGVQDGNPESVGSDEEKATPTKDEQWSSDVEFRWRARDNRKGRHDLLIHPARTGEVNCITPKPTTGLREVGKGILRMCTVFPYWDVSYLVATIFTLGSAVWVINAFFAWLPIVAPSTEFHNETFVGGGVTAFIGATIFEIGSVLLMFEAVNENSSGCFGWAVEQAWDEHKQRSHFRVHPTQDECNHHHANKHNFVGKGHGKATLEPADVNTKDGKTWQWYPSWHSLKTHYFHELGFLACLSQFIGATIFWISGFTALPGVINHLSQRVENGVFWVPQIVGGTGFIVSGTLFMLETQSNWYTPAFGTLGWHIGFWNLIGAFGFTLCGALGPASANTGVAYESSLATFWGSWAFLIGSTIQWYESLDKHPVEEQD